MEKFKGKFIGENEISEVHLSERVTPTGGKILDVTFKDKTKKQYTEKILPYIVTDKRSDASEVQTKKLMPIIRECMEVIIEFDMNYEDLESFSKQLFSNMTLQYDRAESFMWHGNDKEFVPGFDSRYGVSILDAHKVLEQNGESET